MAQNTQKQEDRQGCSAEGSIRPGAVLQHRRQRGADRRGNYEGLDGDSSPRRGAQCDLQRGGRRTRLCVRAEQDGSGAAALCPGPTSSGKGPFHLPDCRVGADVAHLELALQETQATLATMQGQNKRPSTPLKAEPKRRAQIENAPPGWLGGLDPLVAQQALQAGVSKEALAEIAASLQPRAAVPQKSLPAPNMNRMNREAGEPSSDEDGEEWEDDVLAYGGASGSQDQLSKAVLQMSKILGEMHKEKKSGKDRSLEAILDRAEGGSAKEPGSGSRSKAAALRSLQGCSSQTPHWCILP